MDPETTRISTSRIPNSHERGASAACYVHALLGTPPPPSPASPRACWASPSTRSQSAPLADAPVGTRRRAAGRHAGATCRRWLTVSTRRGTNSYTVEPPAAPARDDPELRGEYRQACRSGTGERAHGTDATTRGGLVGRVGRRARREERRAWGHARPRGEETRRPFARLSESQETRVPFSLRARRAHLPRGRSSMSASTRPPARRARRARAQRRSASRSRSRRSRAGRGT